VRQSLLELKSDQILHILPCKNYGKDSQDAQIKQSTSACSQTSGKDLMGSDSAKMTGLVKRIKTKNIGKM